MSLPSWERGLKYKINVYAPINLWSLPSWERGLKYLKKLPVVGSDHVAPLVGAWIEIETAAGGGTGNMSLPSWERGLKLSRGTIKQNINSRSPRGSVD